MSADGAGRRGRGMKLQTKKILITGGTGSFGNKVAAFLESHNPREIVIFSRDE